MGAIVTWKGKMAFDGEASSGFHLPLDTSKDLGGDENGFRPMELLLVGLAGCTSMDVISILKKSTRMSPVLKSGSMENERQIIQKCTRTS